MSHAIVATVGTSDFVSPDELLESAGKEFFRQLKSSFKIDTPDYIKLVGKVKGTREYFNSARIWGKGFLDWDETNQLAYVQDKPERFPLLRPALQAEDEPDANGKKRVAEKVSRIILLATDNSSKQRDNDTVYYAEIIKKYLGKAFPSFQPITPEILLLEEDAENYDAILREIQKKLPELSSEEYERVYVLPTGGTPAMSSALLIAAASLYRARLRVLYTSLPDTNTGSRAAPRQIGRILYGSQLQREIERLINRYDYSGALELVEENASFLQVSRQKEFEAFKVLLEHAQARLLFDFGKAEDQLQKYLRVNSAAADELRAYQPLTTTTDLNEKLAYGRGAIAELYWHLWVYWKSERYADYLVRLKTLTDRLNIFALEIITAIPLSYDEAKYNQDALGRKDFEDLGGLNKAFIGPDQNNPIIREIDFSKNIGASNRIKGKGPYKLPIFGKETDVAGQLAIHICDKVSHDQTPDSDVPKRSDTFDKSTALALKNLLDAIQYKGTGIYESGSRVMFNLTKLRNSLPPAHSFGYIDQELIKAASQFPSDSWDVWPHEKIGQLLTAIPNMSNFNVGTDGILSPFEQINQLLKPLLKELSQETNVRATE